MERRVHKVLMSWLLVVAIGGHWPLLQSVAWVKMLVSFAQTDGLKTAVAKTFDGKHPCQICSLVKKGKEAEQKQAAHAPTLKIDFFLVSAERFVVKTPIPVETFSGVPSLCPRADAPVLPPPKRA